MINTLKALKHQLFLLKINRDKKREAIELRKSAEFLMKLLSSTTPGVQRNNLRASYVKGLRRWKPPICLKIWGTTGDVMVL